MYVIVINQDGYIVEKCVILNDDGTLQGYKLKENEIIVDFNSNNNFNDFLKHKWDGTKFIEGATMDEIAEWKANQPKPQPSELDLLKEQIINLQAYEVEKVEKQYMEVANV